jgi:two-component system, NarL family, response regulator NreC
VVLAESHGVLRHALRLLFEREGGFRVVGEAGDARQALELVKRLSPRLLVLDLSMPERDAVELVERVRRAAPETRVLVLAPCGAEGRAAEAMRAGASACILKEADVRELLATARGLARGAAVPGGEERAPRPAAESYEALTPREREVLKLVMDGLVSAEIAERLGISARTVEAHRAHVMKKLGVRGRTELLRYAFTHGLLAHT